MCSCAAIRGAAMSMSARGWIIHAAVVLPSPLPAGSNGSEHNRSLFRERIALDRTEKQARLAPGMFDLMGRRRRSPASNRHRCSRSMIVRRDFFRMMSRHCGIPFFAASKTVALSVTVTLTPVSGRNRVHSCRAAAYLRGLINAAERIGAAASGSDSAEHPI